MSIVNAVKFEELAAENERLRAQVAELHVAQRWRLIETCPLEGTIIVASYAPTNWAYCVQTVVLHPELPVRHRELQLRYARGWLPLPAPPRLVG